MSGPLTRKTIEGWLADIDDYGYQDGEWHVAKEPFRKLCNLALSSPALEEQDIWHPVSEPPTGSGGRWIMCWLSNHSVATQWWTVGFSKFGHNVREWAEMPKRK